MTNRLANAMSPYLQAHAGNPVDWWPWGEDAFSEAVRRDVPLFISIGYSTCHWCHVMARESFSDAATADYLNAHFVNVKIDREEHPGADATYLAQAGAFTSELGWPLSVFATTEGIAFYAGTYFPPKATSGRASFRQVLEAVTDAWRERRDEVQHNASAVGAAIANAFTTNGRTLSTETSAEALPAIGQLRDAATAIAEQEDSLYGGFGGAPKFPIAPALGFLHSSGHDEIAARTLERMANSPLRDEVDGGFFRYSVERDWRNPHYERMLYDNAQLLNAYIRSWVMDDSRHWAAETATGIATFLRSILQLPSGGFASAQDSESAVGGERSEGGYYELSAEMRTTLEAPALDDKVLAGWNGLAIGAMARAGFVLGRPDWIDAARAAADYLVAHHLDSPGRLIRASREGRRSDAVATLEDYGMLASGLIQLSLATGVPGYAVQARTLIDAVLDTGSNDASLNSAEPTTGVFTEPGGADPVLAARRLALASDPSEGAYPSGISACSKAARELYVLTGDRRYRDAAAEALSFVAPQALANPIAFGATLEELTLLVTPETQLVLITPGESHVLGELASVVQAARADIVAIASEHQARDFATAGFELYSNRVCVDGRPTAYLCEDFVCRRPFTDATDFPAARLSTR